MKLFNRKPVPPREDPRHVPESDPSAVLLAMLITDSVDGDIGHSSGLIPLGGWTDEDKEAFSCCLVDSLRNATKNDQINGDSILIEYASEIIG